MKKSWPECPNAKYFSVLDVSYVFFSKSSWTTKAANYAPSTHPLAATRSNKYPLASPLLKMSFKPACQRYSRTLKVLKMLLTIFLSEALMRSNMT